MQCHCATVVQLTVFSQTGTSVNPCCSPPAFHFIFKFITVVNPSAKMLAFKVLSLTVIKKVTNLDANINKIAVFDMREASNFDLWHIS